MIVGNGAIARCLQDRENAIFFASGVSNSRCEDKNEFDRERRMLFQIKRDKACIFYFSSIAASAFHKHLYFRHKCNMEHYIRLGFQHYVILRIGNLIGDTNPNTFINYIKDRQAKGLSVEIRDETKFMIDGATLNMLCQTLPLDQKIELTVATKIGKVRDFL